MIDKIMGRIPLLLQEPVGAVVVALVAYAVLRAFAKAHPRDHRPGRAGLPPLLRVTAVVVLAAWMFESLTRRAWVSFPDIAWWAFAVPSFLAALGIGSLLVVRGRHDQRRRGPAFAGVRRTWSSFVDPRALATAGALVALLVVTTVVSGLAASPDEYGRSILLTIGDSGSTTFYGWAFGVPVLVALAALLAVAIGVLSRIAAPPFSGGGTAALEREQRRAASHSVLSLGTAAIALTTGAVFEFLGRSGAGMVGAGIPGVGDFTWTTGYVAFAGAFTWGGWILAVIACMALISLAAGVSPVSLLVPRSRMRTVAAR